MEKEGMMNVDIVIVSSVSNSTKMIPTCLFQEVGTIG